MPKQNSGLDPDRAPDLSNNTWLAAIRSCTIFASMQRLMSDDHEDCQRQDEESVLQSTVQKRIIAQSPTMYVRTGLYASRSDTGI